MEPNENKIENSEKIYYGGIGVLYARKNGELKFLVVQNAKSGKFSFASGAKEDTDKSETDTIYRELGEELRFDGDLSVDDIKLEPTGIKQSFVFGPNKKERAGHKGEYTFFLGDVSDICDKISFNPEDLSGIYWLSREEAHDKLSFEDVKELFLKATENLE